MLTAYEKFRAKMAALEAAATSETTRCWVFHRWGKWRLTKVMVGGDDFYTAQIRECKRCGKTQTAKVL